jgi:hypothetical protein
MATQSVKDILDTEIPKPSFVLSPSVPAPLPSGVTLTRNGQDNVARTLDPYSNKFEQVEEDTPRVYGSDQGLLVEATQRTNQQTHSSNFSEWTDFSSPFGTSAITGQAAYRGGGDGTDTARWTQEAGSMPSGEFIAYAITEKKDVDLVGWGVRDTSQGGPRDFIAATYEFSGDSIQVHEEKNGTIKEANSRILGQGPNGGTLVQLTMRLTGTQGNSRRGVILTDMGAGTSGNESLWHHFQIEDTTNATSPIVTDSTTKTRASDNYEIKVGSWFNNSGSTFILTISPLFFRSTSLMKVLHNRRNTAEWVLIGSNEPPYNIACFDGSSGFGRNNVAPPFTPVKIAVSASQSEKILSVNGQSASGNHNGNLLSPGDKLIIGDDNTLIASVRKISYIPRALSESTLNTLTS